MPDKKNRGSGKFNADGSAATPHRGQSSNPPDENEPAPVRHQDAGTTTTRDTTEVEAYSKAHPSSEAEHATNQTTDESLRRKRSHNRG